MRPAAQERDFVAVDRFLQIVSRQKHRDAELRSEPCDVAPDGAAVGQVQPDRRLVQKQDLRLMDDAACDVECAAHPAGKRRDRPIPLLAQAEELQQARRCVA